MTRTEWLERAIAETREFIEMVERDHALERGMARFGSEDYDYEIALKHHAEVARKTLEALQDEQRKAEAIYGVRQDQQD